MAWQSDFALLLVCTGALASGASAAQTPSAPTVCTIARTESVRIPVAPPASVETTEPANARADVLTVSHGDADEPPEGPDGFDVLADGSLLITDPLRNRLASFDAQGKFRKAWDIGFAADSVTVVANGLVAVREAGTGQLHAFDEEGHAHPAEKVRLPDRPESQVVTGENRGSVDRPRNAPLAIRLEKAGFTLLSVESLATDKEGGAYVALEATSGSGSSDAINLNKYVRKYSSDGKLLFEIADIPLDYYIPPVDELRVHKGVLYQLQPTGSDVRMNLWNTNEACSRPSQ